jgi:hypothetical protein
MYERFPFPQHAPEKEQTIDILRDIQRDITSAEDLLSQIDIYHTRNKPDPNVYGPDTKKYRSVGECIQRLSKVIEYLYEIAELINYHDPSDGTHRIPHATIREAKRWMAFYSNDLKKAHVYREQWIGSWMNSNQHGDRQTAEREMTKFGVALVEYENAKNIRYLLQDAQSFLSGNEKDYNFSFASTNTLNKITRGIQCLCTATTVAGKFLYCEDPTMKAAAINVYHALRNEELKRYRSSPFTALWE